MSIYSQVAKEVNKLNAVRDRHGQEGMISGSSAITNNDEANTIPPAANRSRRGSVAGKASTLREVYTPSLEEKEKEKELMSSAKESSARPAYGQDGRTISVDSTASSSTARQSVDAEGEEDEDDDDFVSGGGSSRNVSAMSTPFEERGNHLDRFPPPRRFSSARQSPALSPPLDEDTITDSAGPKTPRASSQHLDEAAEEPSTSVDEVAAEMEQQHLSQVDVKPPTETNRVDQVLNDVFSLLSLFFLTIGKTKESPGVYCQIASMRVSWACRSSMRFSLDPDRADAARLTL